MEDGVVAKTSLGKVAYVLVLVGGILMVLFSLLGFLDFPLMMPFGIPCPNSLASPFWL